MLDAVIDQLPLPSAVALPREVLPDRNNSTVALASPVPVNVGELLLVLSSVLELPVSLPEVRSGVEGAEGALVSIVTAKSLDDELVFPAVSVAVAVNV